MSAKISKFLSVVKQDGVFAGMLAGLEYILRNLPEQAKYIVFPVYSLFQTDLNTSILYKRNGYYVVYNITRLNSFAIPKLDWHLLQMNDINSGNGFETAVHASKKYQLEGFVEIDDEDVVVDVGGFIGAFSISAAHHSDKVILVEPEETNIKCSRYNLNANDIKNVKAVRKAISDQNERVTLNIAEDPTDHSLINTDSDHQGSRTVEAITLEELAEQNDLPRVDFLKMDAEGFEREIVQSIDNLSITKLAIDCSPEASTSSDADHKGVCDELKETLEGKGYKTRLEEKHGWEVIYAKK